ncbi:hypothetical protein BXZ70DRAFT_362408 [Cristinia sonorae]|uniref:C2H2-type domain-containing protein n=1 Tax=Cristinia sonorae TaxID=1940300 RepID=A0A8K0UJ89_9AGAR|nr:hypothetical protein BXZ70DRAFT_362408 [Cristinia sonorae]
MAHYQELPIETDPWLAFQSQSQELSCPTSEDNVIADPQPYPQNWQNTGLQTIINHANVSGHLPGYIDLDYYFSHELITPDHFDDYMNQVIAVDAAARFASVPSHMDGIPCAYQLQEETYTSETPSQFTETSLSEFSFDSFFTDPTPIDNASSPSQYPPGAQHVHTAMEAHRAGIESPFDIDISDAFTGASPPAQIQLDLNPDDTPLAPASSTGVLYARPDRGYTAFDDNPAGQRFVLDMETTDTKTKKRFACEVCGRCFGTRYNMRKHTTAKHLPKSEQLRFACCGCPRNYSRKSDLKRHIRNYHPKMVVRWDGDAIVALEGGHNNGKL